MSATKRILVTGMTGTGKSTTLPEPAKRGHRVVATDSDEWKRWLPLPTPRRIARHGNVTCVMPMRMAQTAARTSDE